jgi:hypothetical protein
VGEGIYQKKKACLTQTQSRWIAKSSTFFFQPRGVFHASLHLGVTTRSYKQEKITNYQMNTNGIITTGAN